MNSDFNNAAVMLIESLCFNESVRVWKEPSRINMFAKIDDKHQMVASVYIDDAGVDWIRIRRLPYGQDFDPTGVLPKLDIAGFSEESVFAAIVFIRENSRPKR